MNSQTKIQSKFDVLGTSSGVRDSNIELFRIISMILIIAHHYVVNSGLIDAGGVIYSNPTEWKSMFLLLFGAWGKTGINCFILITGYFMCKSKITLKKFTKLLLEIYFYRWIGYVVFLIAGYETVSIANIIKLLLPIASVSHGFVECYLIFFLCIPFLNILVNNMTKRQHIGLLLLTGTVYIMLGSVPKISVVYNYVTWFCVLYFFSSYVRLHPVKLFDNARFWGGSAY